MRDREAFQKSVKAYLKTGKSSLTELSLELNYTREHLSRILHGQANMTAESVQHTVKALVTLGCLHRRDQARRLLQLMDIPDFPAEDWNANPLSRLDDSSTSHS
ncbi:hypothetical protein KSF_066380 [Reticulibacter mediterranei]|uniref:Uncharacterized protein n=1 Tax=Reticulibacter mediterranei TaxID=2778369 RepID=A0A8J3IQD7_9CHLR|nr:hypothetical protein KSF_066380 [Reticulibacter mediterranei]